MAAETKWTPGPWEYQHQSATVMAPPEYVQIAHCMSAPGCGMLHDMDEVRANARLIAAAPDLYEALREAESLVLSDRCFCSGIFTCSRCKVLAMTAAALRRARGEEG